MAQKEVRGTAQFPIEIKILLAYLEKILYLGAVFEKNAC